MSKPFRDSGVIFVNNSKLQSLILAMIKGNPTSHGQTVQDPDFNIVHVSALNKGMQSRMGHIDSRSYTYAFPSLFCLCQLSQHA